MDNKHPELFGPLDEITRTAAPEPSAAGTEAKPADRLSALKMLTDRLPPDERAQLIQLARESHWVDNDPMLILQTFGQAKLDAIVADINATLADFNASTVNLLQTLEEIKSAEVGLSKYREHYRQHTEETKTAAAEAGALLNVLLKTKETATTILEAKLRAERFRTAFLTAACMVGADLLIRLALAVFH